MNKKIQYFLIVFAILGFCCFAKVSATSLDLNNLKVSSSCSLQSIQNCNKNDLIMILIQLILSKPNNVAPIIETPSINIIAPTSGDILTAGETYAIKWESKNLPKGHLYVYGPGVTLLEELPITATVYYYEVPESCAGGTCTIWVSNVPKSNWEREGVMDSV